MVNDWDDFVEWCNNNEEGLWNDYINGGNLDISFDTFCEQEYKKIKEEK